MGSGLSKEDLSKKHIVIIGGGYGGSELATLLLKHNLPFTLIDPKDFFHHNVAALRAAVNPEWMPKTGISYALTFGDKFVQAKVTSVDFESNKVHLDNGDVIEFTDLVFAVGSDGPFPGRALANVFKDASNEYLKLSQAIDKANDIVIVGGGAVGVEIAGEIGDKYKAKTLTLIHPNEDLVGPGFSPGFQANIRHALEQTHKVKLILNDRVDNLTELQMSTCLRQTVKTKNGLQIESDLVLKCTGMKPCVGLTKSLFGPETFDDFDRLKVDEFLHIHGFEHVFGIGDCVNTPEHKMAAHASTHAHLVASNLIRELKGEKLQPYKPGNHNPEGFCRCEKCRTTT